MWSFLKKLFGRRTSTDEDAGPDEERVEGQERQNDEQIVVHSCEVVDVEIVDDTLH